MATDRLSYPLGDGVTAFSTRRGIAPAEASDPYAGFSVCDYTDDSPARVARARRCLAEESTHEAATPARLIIPRQRHSLNVAVVDESTTDGSPDNVDALVTATPSLMLCINTADCVPLLLADPVARVIGAAHSGWRGTVGRIAALTVEAMAGLGADPGRICCAIGPSICTECFEVGPEVAERFPADCVDLSFGARPHVDLRRAVIGQLVEAGIPAANILPPAPCSRCHPADFFSARRLGIASGRTLSAVMLAGR